jgi:hypothetical protein
MVQQMSDEKILEVLTDIRNWTRAASYASVKALLEAALPDAKSRTAYQMSDGSASREHIRVACKMSPNSLVALGQRCTAMGLMEEKGDKRRVRLFDLGDFGLIDSDEQPDGQAKKNERQTK